MKRLIIAFGHQRRRGKDTAAKMTQEILIGYGHDCAHDYFARPLKEGIGKHVFGFTHDQCYGPAKMEVDTFWGITPREAFQRAGTEAMRNGFDRDIWARSLERRLTYPSTSLWRNYVVSDMRFSNEVEAIQRLGGVTVLCQREVASGPEDDHDSETALADYIGWDFQLDNNGTRDALRQQVQRMVESLIE